MPVHGGSHHPVADPPVGLHEHLQPQPGHRRLQRLARLHLPPGGLRVFQLQRLRTGHLPNWIQLDLIQLDLIQLDLIELDLIELDLIELDLVELE